MKHTARPGRKIKLLAGLAAGTVALAGWLLWGNTALEVNEYIIASPEIPQAFHEFRIAQVSDLHNCEIGQQNQRLLSALEQARPDIIVITGDLLDSRNTKPNVALQFAQKAAEITQCYYVPGNHESRQWPEVYAGFEAGLRNVGVTVLRNEEVVLEREGEQISLVGIDDPAFTQNKETGTRFVLTSEEIGGLFAPDKFKILLTHRPEAFERYVQAGVDLVFAGHAHGGQVRLPFIGGVVAPHQGWFPQYDGGLYTQGDTRMLLSRGVGNSLCPLRVNNRPEVVVAQLERT